MARLLSVIVAFAFAASLGTIATAATSSSTGSMATPTSTPTHCKDPKTGKFVKCPTPTTSSMATPKPKQCRDPKTGKFVKCPASTTSSSMGSTATPKPK